MTESLSELELLRQQLEATTDPALRTALEAAIAALEAAQNQDQDQKITVIDGASDGNGRQNEQTIGDSATVDVAVTGDIHGDVQTDGARYAALIQVFFQTVGIDHSDVEQRELLESYLSRLVYRCDRLRLHGIVDWERKKGKAPTFTLSQVYVSLATNDWATVAESDSEGAFVQQIEAGDPNETLPQDSFQVRVTIHGEPFEGELAELRERERVRYTLMRPILLTEALSKRRHIVLLGGPGSGKSSFLRHLAVALASAGSNNQPLVDVLPGWKAGPLLPIYASLGGYAAWVQQRSHDFDADSLWDYLVATSEDDALVGLKAQLRCAFRKGGLLLLLDGLDEVAEPALRAAVARATAALAGRHQGYVVVTCRSLSFVGDTAAPCGDWGEPVILAPFAFGQIKHFVRGWYACSADQGVFDRQSAEQRAETLIERIATLSNLRDLSKTPLLLTIITILHYYEGKLPEDRADLYEDLVQLLLTRWTQTRREMGAPLSLLDRLNVPGLRDFHLRGVLEALAYRAHQAEQTPDGRGLLEKGVVREALIALFQQFDLGPGPANEKAEEVLEYLEDESGLLLHEGGERYGLPHLTYEEYLTACHLVKQESEFQTLAYNHWRTDASRWSEVILLALGRMVRTDKRESAAAWLHFLVASYHGDRERDETELQYAALFAAECLQDIGGKSAVFGVTTIDLPALWERLAATLARVVEGTVLPAAERIKAGAHLATLGDPREGVGTLPPAMVRITGGKFVIGEPLAQDQYDDQVNDNTLIIAPFEIARYPVTNAQYACFIDDGGYNPDAAWWDEAGHDWLTSNDTTAKDLKPWQQRTTKEQPEFWNDERFGAQRSNYPVVGISWYEALAFCRWLTQHKEYNPEGYVYTLPSEAEWEYAARGKKRRIYPWGSEQPDEERANFHRRYNGATPVGCFPLGATPEGVFDLAGNVWEWTRSEYRDYPYDPSDGREDCSNPAEKLFTVRGGSWVNLSLYLRASDRDQFNPDLYINLLGFRLIRRREQNR
jgi:formylglycine-generating enzyme required for sulfatase activity